MANFKHKTQTLLNKDNFLHSQVKKKIVHGQDEQSILLNIMFLHRWGDFS